MTRASPEDIEPGQEALRHVSFATFARAATQRHVAPPLILSLAVATALVASLLELAVPLSGEIGAALNPAIERFLGNGYSRAIIVLFLASVLYGAMQLIGIAVDRDRLRRLSCCGGDAGASWLALLSGRSLRPPDAASWTGAVSGDPYDIADRFGVHRHRFVELGLLPLRFVIWVLPLLGFIGTVVGIARSIIGLEAVIAAGSGGQSADGLLTVLGGLQFAFDTTLLGLITVIPVMMLHMFLSGRESDVTEECEHRILTLMASSSSSSRSPMAAGGAPPPEAHDAAPTNPRPAFPPDSRGG